MINITMKSTLTYPLSKIQNVIPDKKIINWKRYSVLFFAKFFSFTSKKFWNIGNFFSQHKYVKSSRKYLKFLELNFKLQRWIRVSILLRFYWYFIETTYFLFSVHNIFLSSMFEICVEIIKIHRKSINVSCRRRQSRT